MGVELAFTLPGAPRTKGNHPRIVVRGKVAIRLPSKAHQAWHQVAAWHLRAAVAQRKDLALPIATRVNVRALFYRDADRGDLDNYFKAVGDLLQRGGVVANDKLITWDGSRLLLDRQAPRVDLLLTWDPAPLESRFTPGAEELLPRLAPVKRVRRAR